MDIMDKDFEKIFALKPIVPDTNQRNTRVFKNEIGLILGGINIHGT